MREGGKPLNSDELTLRKGDQFLEKYDNILASIYAEVIC